MTVAVFDYTAWSARYPNLAPNVSETLAEQLFVEAALYCDNTDCSPVPADPATYQPRLMLLGMIVAHLAVLQGRDSDGDGGPVGRITDAAQGSVSVKFEMDDAKRGAWFKQTQYGSNFWSATAQYRLGRWFPAARRRR